MTLENYLLATDLFLHWFLFPWLGYLGCCPPAAARLATKVSWGASGNLLLSLSLRFRSPSVYRRIVWPSVCCYLHKLLISEQNETYYHSTFPLTLKSSTVAHIPTLKTCSSIFPGSRTEHLQAVNVFHRKWSARSSLVKAGSWLYDCCTGQ